MIYLACWKNKPGPGTLQWDQTRADNWLDAWKNLRKRTPYGDPYGGPYVARCFNCKQPADKEQAGLFTCEPCSKEVTTQ